MCNVLRSLQKAGVGGGYVKFIDFSSLYKILECCSSGVLVRDINSGQETTNPDYHLQ